MNQKPPLWLPDGSVRSITLLVLVIGFIVGFFQGIVSASDYKDILLLFAAAYGITRLPSERKP